MSVRPDEARIRHARGICDRRRSVFNRLRIVVGQEGNLGECHMHRRHLGVLIKEAVCLLFGDAQSLFADETADEVLIDFGGVITCSPGTVEVGPGGSIRSPRESRLSALDKLLSCGE